uniref:Uncharacterized protein n=1 Tax=Anopheles quadriannulatus TaxID=34691 RepID=A0A182XSC2_ANOQN
MLHSSMKSILLFFYQTLSLLSFLLVSFFCAIIFIVYPKCAFAKKKKITVIMTSEYNFASNDSNEHGFSFLLRLIFLYRALQNLTVSGFDGW